MSKSALDNSEPFYARNRAEWRQWLEDNSSSAARVWLIYYKKGTDEPCVTYEEAVEEALSFGWIDSKVDALDDKRYMQLYTPRKNGSNWSKSNKERVKRLIKNGRMTSAGMEKVKAAKKDGSWNILDDVEDLKIPADLQEALNENTASLKNFNSFTDSSKKQIIWWVISAKRPETRKNRIKRVVKLAEKNQRP